MSSKVRGRSGGVTEPHAARWRGGRSLAIGALVAAWALVGAAQVPAPAPAAPEPTRPPFAEWMTALREEARGRGISAAIVTQVLAFDEPLEVVVARDRTQAETVLAIDQYVSRWLTRPFVTRARSRAAAHRGLLGKVSARYGVQSRFVVAIWGLESNFGRLSGIRPTVHALATLAWEGRRATLFRNELFAALEVLEQGYITPERMRGSWAGAMGQTQFMPSSYLKYAADFDGDGRRDIWSSPGDIFASIANYLKEHGWDETQTWGREVRLPSAGWAGLSATVGLRPEGCRATREMTVPRPLDAWRELGVRAADGSALPRAERDASLLWTGRRAFLVYGNYESLLAYNCAHAYALSVSLLADRIGE